MTDKTPPVTPGASPASGSPTTSPNTGTPNAANKAGDTKTTSKEYVKREHGKENVPGEEQKNMGQSTPTQDDVEHPEQHSDKPEESEDEGEG